MQERGGCIHGRAAAGMGDEGSARRGECMRAGGRRHGRRGECTARRVHERGRHAGASNPVLTSSACAGVVWFLNFTRGKWSHLVGTENVALFPGKPWTVVEDSFVLDESLGALHILHIRNDNIA